MSRISDHGSSRFCLIQYLIDLFFARSQVPEAELCGVWYARTMARVFGKLASRIKGKDEITLQMKHHYGPGWMLVISFELVAGNTLRGQAEPVAVKHERPVQVIDRESDNSDLRLHGSGVRVITFSRC